MNYQNNVKYIEIYDIKGEVLLITKSVQNKISLNVRDFSTGIYIVKIKTEDSNYIGKFCKN